MKYALERYLRLLLRNVSNSSVYQQCQRTVQMDKVIYYFSAGVSDPSFSLPYSPSRHGNSEISARLLQVRETILPVPDIRVL